MDKGGIMSGNSGVKFLKNYTYKDYDHYPQNWAIIQDSRGIIYVGNNAGLLEFDGVSWRVINVPNWSIRSLAIDNAGTIYIGGNNEIGFFTPDGKGTLKYTSLVGHLNDNQKNFSYVRNTHATKEGIYFESEKFVFRWTSGKLDVWEASQRFIASSYCNGSLYVQQENVGLLQMVNDSLKLIPGGEKFFEAEIFMMAPYDSTSEKLLIATRSKGLYIYEKNSIVPFPTEVDIYLKNKELYQGIRLSSGDFALATLKGGLVIIDSSGKLKHLFDKSWGLQDEDVKNVFQDNQGNLWLPLNNGISKIEYTSPFVIYDDQTSLTGMVLSVVKHQKKIYAGTTSGLFWLTSTGKFKQVLNISDICWSLLSIKNSLLAASDGGLFQINWGQKEQENIAIKVIEFPSLFLLRSKKAANRIWVGTRQGLISLYLENKTAQWQQELKFKNINQPIYFILETSNGSLWLSALTKGVIKVDFPADINNQIVSRYDTTHGLPSMNANVFLAAGHVMFATEKGLFRFDEYKKIFLPDKTLGNEFAKGSTGVFRIAEDKNKNIWIHSMGRNIQAMTQPDGIVVLKRKPFLRMPIAQVNSIYPDPGGEKTWFAANNGLFCYHTTTGKNFHQNFSALIRKVKLINREFLIFDGYQAKIYQNQKAESFYPILNYKDRNLRFQFAAPFFEEETSTTYQVFLDGYDDDWSQWSTETQKDYTNLDAGNYTFRVRAKNVYDNISREAAFRFRVLPPWHKTWWAFCIYGAAALFIVYLVVRWRSRKLLKEKQHLAQIIEDRTREIREKNRQLEEQSEKLKEMDKVKSRFFANISHEFRTPLTLIMGPLEKVLSTNYAPNREEFEKDAKVMLRSSQRLLHMVNQLLDLSKFESGQMKLQTSSKNIVPFLKTMIASFESMALQFKLDLVLHIEQEEMPLYFDADKLEKVMVNLLSNAIKFTPPGGKVTVSAGKTLTKDLDFPHGFLEISVSDTGPGIPGDQLLRIFDRFYQAAGTHEHHQKGSGIGLALTKELVMLHHGTIEARNREEKGSEFIIRLPLGSEHLAPDEIIEASSTQITPPTHSSISGKIPDLERITETGERKKEIEPETKTAETNIILVVEDSTDMRVYIRGALEPGYTVIDAKDGREGIEKAKVIIPDLIISDIMMPEKDGYELCSVLKNDIKTSHIPIIMLTAKASEENILQGLETGADDYITKPFNTKILIARIKNLIDIRSQLQKNINRQMTLQPVKTSVSKIDQAFFHDLHDVINKNLSDEEFNVEQLCKKLYMGRTTLYRKVLALTGETPTDFIRSYRLKRGAELLKQNFGTVLEVAFEVGFSNSSYFAKCFKEKFHQLPSEYQAANKPHGMGGL
jgi:signal transduction histidine kinase/DNA-binding response OmpR family regulator/ligand-binding sensor domain-containing protein